MLKLSHVTKSFPGVRALDDVSIDFLPGEIHAVLGENGAGKSTLIKIICGIYRLDVGEVSLDDTSIDLHSFHDALETGISLVNQEIQVISESTIAENIMLDKLERYTKFGKIDWKALESESKKYLDMVGLDMDPSTKIEHLSAAKKQLIQIAKALSREAKILLLDEPTSSITKHEVGILFRLLNELKKKEIVIIFVTHKLEEVFEICDTVTVLRDGVKIDTKPIGELDIKSVIQMMIGRDSHEEHFGFLNINHDNVVLEAKEISRSEEIEHASFKLYEGEILGFYGLVGSGRTELAKVLIGHSKADSGEIYVNGEPAKMTSVADSLYRYNIGYITENRKEEGLFLDFSVETNITITIWRRILNKVMRFIRPKDEREAALEMVDALDIRITGIGQITQYLSGGNQQKVSISKWLAANCDILIVDEPTVGVDVGAKAAIHELIWNLAYKEHKSIILISSDMPEMANLARRVLVFRERQIVAEITGLNEKAHTYAEVSEQIGQHLA